MSRWFVVPVVHLPPLAKRIGRGSSARMKGSYIFTGILISSVCRVRQLSIQFSTGASVWDLYDPCIPCRFLGRQPNKKPLIAVRGFERCNKLLYLPTDSGAYRHRPFKF